MRRSENWRRLGGSGCQPLSGAERRGEFWPAAESTLEGRCGWEVGGSAHRAVWGEVEVTVPTQLSALHSTLHLSVGSSPPPTLLVTVVRSILSSSLTLPCVWGHPGDNLPSYSMGKLVFRRLAGRELVRRLHFHFHLTRGSSLPWFKCWAVVILLRNLVSFFTLRPELGECKVPY